ncbi:MAG TPA: aminopeptidase N, partial [Xanthomonadales bacterium]|nr:aminopeptidase N [Xanthomonadales bacterium]
MKEGTGRKVIKRSDYTPYPWAVESAAFRFEIGQDVTHVSTTMELRRSETNSGSGNIVLDGQNLEFVSATLDGRLLENGEYTLGPDSLIIHKAPEHCTLQTEVRIRPKENTALEGLYPSGDFLLTQCEAEGFRKITYFPDRPDVMTKYDVTIVADEARYPVLLSNG